VSAEATAHLLAKERAQEQAATMESATALSTALE
jgi:hypothetical protein